MPKAAAAKISNVAPANVTIGTDSPAVILGAEPVAKTLVKALPATKKPVPVATVATLVAAVKPVETPAPKTVRKTAAKPAAETSSKPVAKPASKPVAKPAIKPATKPAAKRAAGKTAPPAVTLDTATEVVRERAHKTKLVRDSFTMPEHEYAVLGQVKKACLKAGFEIKKSELLRIGVALISQLDLATLQSVLAGLPQLKTGRPNKV